jgi:hypothetical protein
MTPIEILTVGAAIVAVAARLVLFVRNPAAAGSAETWLGAR